MSGLRGFPPTVSIEPTRREDSPTLADMVAEMRAQVVGQRIADCRVDGNAIEIVTENGAKLRFATAGGFARSLN